MHAAALRQPSMTVRIRGPASIGPGLASNWFSDNEGPKEIESTAGASRVRGNRTVPGGGLRGGYGPEGELGSDDRCAGRSGLGE